MGWMSTLCPETVGGREEAGGREGWGEDKEGCGLHVLALRTR